MNHLGEMFMGLSGPYQLAIVMLIAFAMASAILKLMHMVETMINQYLNARHKDVHDG
jgi:hypothetical protein